MKPIVTVRLFFVVLSGLFTISPTQSLKADNSVKSEGESRTIRVACVGDSITFGARLEERNTQSYPAVLQGLLGKQYEVSNFGVGGCTLIRKGRPNVWSNLEKIKQSKPDIVVISLGTNDTCGGRRACWDHHDDFPTDLKDLIHSFRQLRPSPKIWVCLPTPMVLSTPGLNAERIADLEERSPRLQKLIEEIKSVARDQEVNVLDLNSPLSEKPELFTRKDGVHPNKMGYAKIAKLVHTAISSN